MDATTADVLVICGVAGFAAVAYLAVVRRSLPGADNGGGSGISPPRPTAVRPGRNPDAELLRLLDDPRLAELAMARRSRPSGSRAGSSASEFG